MPTARTPSRTAPTSQPERSNTAAEGLIELWMLRILVPLNGQKRFVGGGYFEDDSAAEHLGFATLFDDDDPSFNRKTILRELRARHKKAERSASSQDVDGPLNDNLRRLADLVGLSAVEVRILAFAVLTHSVRPLDAISECLKPCSSAELQHVLSLLLDIPASEVRKALDSRGTLRRSGLLTLEPACRSSLSHKLTLQSEHFADLMVSGPVEPMALLRDAVYASAAAELGLADFDHLATHLDLLMPYLRTALATRRQGVNILLYGVPGTGKSQLSKALAQALGAPLYEVASEADSGDPMSGSERLRAYCLAQTMLARGPALILFDEIQDVFEASGNPFSSSCAQGHKAWINRQLEDNAAPAFWLTNQISAMDPAFLRRFDMVLDMPVPPRPQREKINRAVCAELVDEATLRRLTDCEVLAPAVIARAAAVVRCVEGDLTHTTPDAALQSLVQQTLLAQGHSGLAAPRACMLPAIYDPAYIHADTDLDAVAEGLVRAGAGRLCLYGAPGTGKTAWAHWLAQRLGRPLLLRRASDLMSAWLGSTEKNMAAAFKQAQTEGAVLLIDEIDSFLQERRGAEHSWEVSTVNEMLTQMEAFNGLFIASTNLLGRLDAAALRRFDLKVHFRPLRTQQAWDLLQRQTAALNIAPPNLALWPRLARLTSLTPGDFAAVARRHRFHPLPSADALVSALEAEVAVKGPSAKPLIGFV